jgi:hypothetical protein
MPNKIFSDMKMKNYEISSKKHIGAPIKKKKE